MIGILLISTRKYKQFVQPLLEQIDKFFLPDHPKTIFVFTDEPQSLKSINRVAQILIPDYKFPYATLFRYKIFSESSDQLKSCSHLFYLDVDMAIVSKVGDEFIKSGLITVRHPGFYVSDGWGDNENPKESTSFMPPEKRKHYYCGGVQGGASLAYLQMSKILAVNISEDESRGIIAQWNDETHYNKYINENVNNVPLTEFDCSYCMVEEQHLRKAWGIDNLEPKIIALAKDHKAIRE